MKKKNERSYPLPGGFVSLPRLYLEPEGNTPWHAINWDQRELFLFLLNKANWHHGYGPPGKYSSTSVPRGSLIMAVSFIARALRSTRDQIRYRIGVLQRGGLIRTQELTDEKAHEWSSFSIVDYDLYQWDSSQMTEEKTHELTQGRPKLDPQSKTSKELKDLQDDQDKSQSKSGAESGTHLNLLAKDSLRRLGYTRPGLSVLTRSIAAGQERIAEGWGLEDLRRVVSRGIKRYETSGSDEKELGHFRSLPWLWGDTLDAEEMRREALMSRDELDHDSVAEPDVSEEGR